MLVTQYVSETPGINGGYPVVAGTRIPVWLLHDYFCQYGGDFAQLQQHFPTLTETQIRGALTYCATNPARVDEDRATQRRAWEQQSGQPWPD